MAAAIAASLNAGSPSKPARTMNKQQAAAALGLLDSDDSNSEDNLETFTDSDDDNSDYDLSSSKEHTPKKVPSCTVKTSATDDSKVSINGHSCSKSSVESISAVQNSGALACDNTITNNVEAIVEPIVPPVEPTLEHWEDFVGSEKGNLYAYMYIVEFILI